MRSHCYTTITTTFSRALLIFPDWNFVSIKHWPSFLWASQVALVVKNPPANAGDVRDRGLIPGSGRSPGGGHGNSLQCSCLENPQGQRSLVGNCPWGREEVDTTEETWHACTHSCVPSIWQPPSTFSINLTILDISCKWNHIIFVLLQCAYFTLHNVFKVLFTWKHVSEFPFLKGPIIFHCMDIPRVFIHSRISEHLRCLTLLANKKSLAQAPWEHSPVATGRQPLKFHHPSQL